MLLPASLRVRYSQRRKQNSVQYTRLHTVYCRAVVVLVVSPLISLMKDQVRAMTEKNMTTVYGGDEDARSEIFL